MTNETIARLLTDIIHIWTRMETTMALNFADLDAAVSDLQVKVDALKGVSVTPPSIDEAAAQAQIDAILGKARAIADEFNAELGRLLNKPAA